jgi:hypothetical protein
VTAVHGAINSPVAPLAAGMAQSSRNVARVHSSPISGGAFESLGGAPHSASVQRNSS